MVVDINVSRAPMVALRGDEVNRRLVISVERNRMGVSTEVADLLQQLGELCSLFGGVREANVLSLCRRGSDETLLTRFMADSASC
jgi:hypothetical protein